MKELPKTFIGKGQVKGFTFTQIKKTDNAYLYLVDTGNGKHYEIFERRENNRFNCVSYPGNKSFGVWAKTTLSETKAFELLKEFDTIVLMRNKNL